MGILKRFTKAPTHVRPDDLARLLEARAGLDAARAVLNEKAVALELVLRELAEPYRLDLAAGDSIEHATGKIIRGGMPRMEARELPAAPGWRP